MTAFSSRAWASRPGLIAFLVVLLFPALALGVRAQPDDDPTDALLTYWSVDLPDVMRPSPAELRQLARLPARPALREAAAPLATYADPTGDRLNKWLYPDDQNQGLSVSGGLLMTELPAQALAIPATFNWRSVTFDSDSASLSAFDQVPNSSNGYYGGSPVSVSDGTNSAIPAYADLTRVQIDPTAVGVRFGLSSRGNLPTVPEAYRLGYNNRILTSSREYVQYIGATAFTASGWRWAIFDAASGFPWWNADLDLTQVSLAGDASAIQFAARVQGDLYSTYADDAAWPRFEWYLDSDNNPQTGDSFSFGYQHGSNVFRYELDGVEAVATAVYDPAQDKWLGMLRRKVGPGQWQTVATATPSLSTDSVTVAFTREEAGVQSTFRWGLLSSFSLARGGRGYFGRVDVAPNSGMQSQALEVDPELLLAEQYAPRLRFASSGDYFPVDIGYALRHASLCGESSDSSDCLQKPTVADLFAHRADSSYLDLAPDNPRQSQALWVREQQGRTPVIYARVVRDGNDSLTAIQYYFFYFYNQWGYTRGCNLNGILCVLGNNHEGDWEMIQIDFLNQQPQRVTASQHHYSSKRHWQHVERADGTHPIVYVGYGSHATYFKDSYYQGELAGASIPFADDNTGRENAELAFQVQLIENDNPAWLSFMGQWGAPSETPGGSGPVGPQHMGTRWTDPPVWSGAAEWDEYRHYGNTDRVGDLHWKPSRASKISVSGNDWPIRVYQNGQLVLGRTTNSLSPNRERAEYISNCAARTETVLLHKLPGQATRAFEYEFAYEPGCFVRSGADEPITITVNLPDAGRGEVSLAQFANVVLPSQAEGWLDLSAAVPTLRVDENNDGLADVVVEPTTVQTAEVDFSAPAAINDLRFMAGNTPELRWTAPADDGPLGRPAAYEVRYATFPLTTDTWSYGQPVPHELVPGLPGSAERLPVTGLWPGRYFFAVRSIDEGYNLAAVSNAAEGQVRSVALIPVALDR